MSEINKNLIKILKKAELGGGKDRVLSQYKKGKLTARERVSVLLDDDFIFLSVILTLFDVFGPLEPLVGINILS